MKSFVSIMLASLLLFCFSDARAQQTEQTQPEQPPTYPTDQNGRWIYRSKFEPVWFEADISKEDITEITSRWHKIDREESAAQNEWIGVYGIYGELHITAMKWSPAEGYISLSINTCMAKIMRAEYGDVQVMGEQVFFYPKKSSGMSHGSGYDGEMPNRNRQPFEFVRAKWRGQHFLVREEDMKDFCDYAAGYAINNYDGLPFYIKGAETGSPDQPPVVPKRFEHLIRKSINGKIISIGKRKIIKQAPGDIEPYFQSETQVVINLGRADGLTDEMSVHILNESACLNGGEFEITEIGEKTSIGVIRRHVEDKPEIPPSRRRDDADYAPIKIGWKATTNQHLYYDHCTAYDSADKQQ